MHDKALKLPWYFYQLINFKNFMDPLYGWGVKATEPLLGDSLLFTFLPTSNFGSVAIRQNSATKNHLFLYHLADRLGLGKPKKISINK